MVFNCRSVRCGALGLKLPWSPSRHLSRPRPNGLLLHELGAPGVSAAKYPLAHLCWGGTSLLASVSIGICVHVWRPPGCGRRTPAQRQPSASPRSYPLRAPARLRTCQLLSSEFSQKRNNIRSQGVLEEGKKTFSAATESTPNTPAKWLDTGPSATFGVAMISSVVDSSTSTNLSAVE